MPYIGSVSFGDRSAIEGRLQCTGIRHSTVTAPRSGRAAASWPQWSRSPVISTTSNLDRVSQYAKRFVLQGEAGRARSGGVSSATPHIISLLCDDRRRLQRRGSRLVADREPTGHPRGARLRRPGRAAHGGNGRGRTQPFRRRHDGTPSAPSAPHQERLETGSICSAYRRSLAGLPGTRPAKAAVTAPGANSPLISSR